MYVKRPALLCRGTYRRFGVFEGAGVRQNLQTYEVAKPMYVKRLALPCRGTCRRIGLFEGGGVFGEPADLRGRESNVIEASRFTLQGNVSAYWRIREVYDLNENILRFMVGVNTGGELSGQATRSLFLQFLRLEPST